MIDIKKLIPIRSAMWESIHQYMRLERQQDTYIAQEIAYYLVNRTDLDDEERFYLSRIANSMIAEQRKECNADGVKTNAEIKAERKTLLTDNSAEK